MDAIDRYVLKIYIYRYRHIHTYTFKRYICWSILSPQSSDIEYRSSRERPRRHFCRSFLGRSSDPGESDSQSTGRRPEFHRVATEGLASSLFCTWKIVTGTSYFSSCNDYVYTLPFSCRITPCNPNWRGRKSWKSRFLRLLTWAR